MVVLDIKPFVDPDEVVGEPEVLIVSEGEQVEIRVDDKEDPKKAFQLVIKLPNGMERLWTVNKTSQRTIARKYTTDTKVWVGKKVVLFLVAQNVRGTMKKVIYARLPEGARVPDAK